MIFFHYCCPGLCLFISDLLWNSRTGRERAISGKYLQPVACTLPLHVISANCTIALSIRLFGNMISGELIVGILLTVNVILYPAVMTGFGGPIGMIQAFIFTVLATVHSRSTQIHEKKGEQHG